MSELIKENQTSLSLETITKLTPAGFLASLTPEQLAEFYLAGTDWQKFISDCMAIIETAMIIDHKPIEGLKVVQTPGRPKSGWTDLKAVAQELKNLGWTDAEIYKPQEMKSFTDIKKALKSEGFKAMEVKGYVQTIIGEPKLAVVSVDDPNPEYIPKIEEK